MTMKNSLKIGIFTFHHAHNYGAFLQCYALQETLKSLGHDVNIIDYSPKYFKEDYAVANFGDFKSLPIYRKVRRIIGVLVLFIPRIIRRNAFLKTVALHLELDDKSFSNVEDVRFYNYDAIIFGSDQIWNPKITRGFDRVFWGDFNFQGKKIAYAASAGDNLVVLEKDAEYIKQRLLTFCAVSAREKVFCIFLGKLGIKAETVLDPTLLLNADKWNSFGGKRKTREEYVLLYIMKPSTDAKKIARKIAKELNLKVKKIFSSVSLNPASWINASCLPVDFVRLFRDARFVVTTSFHGTSFAINFCKEFYAVNTGEQNLRVESLLSDLGLMGRYIQSEEEINLENKVGYKQDRLEVARRKSIAFLNSALYDRIGVCPL